MDFTDTALKLAIPNELPKNFQPSPFGDSLPPAASKTPSKSKYCGPTTFSGVFLNFDGEKNKTSMPAAPTPEEDEDEASSSTAMRRMPGMPSLPPLGTKKVCTLKSD